MAVPRPRAPLNIVRMRPRAQKWFRRKYPGKPPEIAADFASYCVEQWLLGRDPRTKMEWLATDFFEAEGPNRREARALRLLSATPEEQSLDLVRFESSQPLYDDDLPKIQRAAMILHYRWGLNLKEIGDCFGLTETRISQILREGERLTKT